MRMRTRGTRWTVRARVVAAAALLVAAVAPATPAGGAPSTGDGPTAAERLAEAEAYLREHMTSLRIPGLAYAVVRGDEVAAQAAWGIDGDGRPLTLQTPMVLGSTSKSFTALAVMQLVEAGRVELDAPVRRYLPWFRLADADASGRVTVEQLLLQTSGMPPVAALGYTDRYDDSPGALERSVRDLATLRPTAAPGERHQYSDANYQVLGALVEAVTGTPYGEHLRRAVLDPLAMNHTAATAEEARALGVPPGYRYYLGRPRRFAPPFDTSGVPYGFLAASVQDVSHYLIAQLNGGRYRDARVLSAEGVARMHTGRVPTGPRGSYGYGWREGTLTGTDLRIVWHAGAVANSFSHVVLVPDADLAVVVQANSYSLALDGPLTAAGFNVVRILHGLPPVDSAADPVFRWALGGLLVLAVSLLVALVWSLVRAVRGRRRPSGSTRRVLASTAAWVAGCAAVAIGVGWALPASHDGAGLAQVLLFAPDLGHAIVAVVGLATALAVTRVAATVWTLFRTRTAA